MKRVKKFNEFFDTKELKDIHGESPIVINKNFLKENIHKFITKISKINFPFMAAFDEAHKKEGKLDLNGLTVSIDFDKIMDRWNFIIEDEKYKLTLGIVINSISNYNVFIDLDDQQTENIRKVSRFNLNYEELINILNKFYITTIEKYGFENLLKYNRQEYISKYN